MFNVVMHWWSGGYTMIYGIINEKEVVDTVYEVPYGYVKKFEVFKENKLIATFDEFGNMDWSESASLMQMCTYSVH